MTEIERRLIRCVRAVFPEVASDEQAMRASVASVAAWDSLATVVLAAAVEEEFEVQVPPEHLEMLTSVDAYLKLLGNTAPASRTIPASAGA